MTTIKKTLLAAVSAVSLASTANAVDAAKVEEIKVRVVPAGITATTMDGNIGFTYNYKTNGVKYGVAAFVADGTLDLSEIKALGVTSIDYLIVAGGGSGGSWFGGGGGAGGMLTSEDVSVTDVTALTIAVGAGGAGLTKPVNGMTGNDGAPSSITFGDGQPIVAYGGGGGGAFNYGDSGATCFDANGGGSGGGANGSSVTSYYIGLGGKGTPGQGHDGGGRGAKSNRKSGSAGQERLGGDRGRTGDVAHGEVPW